MIATANERIGVPEHCNLLSWSGDQITERIMSNMYELSTLTPIATQTLNYELKRDVSVNMSKCLTTLLRQSSNLLKGNYLSSQIQPKKLSFQERKNKLHSNSLKNKLTSKQSFSLSVNATKNNQSSINFIKSGGAIVPEINDELSQSDLGIEEDVLQAEVEEKIMLDKIRELAYRKPDFKKSNMDRIVECPDEEESKIREIKDENPFKPPSGKVDS